MLKGYVTAATAQRVLGRSRALVTRYCREGRIKGATRVGLQWLIPEKSLRAFLDELRDYHPGNPAWQK
jgi:predicted site-specific integrase-resolvase